MLDTGNNVTYYSNKLTRGCNTRDYFRFFPRVILSTHR